MPIAVPFSKHPMFRPTFIFFLSLGLELFHEADQSRPDSPNRVYRSVRGRLQCVGLYEPACSLSSIKLFIANPAHIGHCGSVEWFIIAHPQRHVPAVPAVVTIVGLGFHAASFLLWHLKNSSTLSGKKLRCFSVHPRLVTIRACEQFIFGRVVGVIVYKQDLEPICIRHDAGYQTALDCDNDSPHAVFSFSHSLWSSSQILSWSMLVNCPYIWELRNQNRRFTRLSFLTRSSRIVLVLWSPIISISRFNATSELIAIPSSNMVSSMFMALFLVRRIVRL